MNISLKITEDICTQLRELICESDGNEVFAVGMLNEEGKVCRITIGSRGNKTAVPVIGDIVRDAEVLIHNHPSGKLHPSDADLSIASTAAENAQGFYIVNNEVTNIYVVVEPIVKKKLQRLDTEALASLLEAGGALDALSQYFEERPSQIELTKMIANAFNKNAVAVCEAGTGVGKSYAYLLPSILWALNNKERVVISTGTINLQQQLIEKDIPMAEQITGKKVKAVLIKGRQNYVCRRRFADVIADADMFADELDELQKIQEWLATTENGSRSDLAFLPSEGLWSRFCSESDACMGMRCNYRESCFIMQVRKEASSAHILVVNHHLLFADLEARMAGAGYEDTAVLPPFNRIIFDEAHAMEQAATSFFSEYFTRFKISKQVSQLYRTRRNSIAGHLIALERLSKNTQRVPEAMTASELLKTHTEELETAALNLIAENSSWRLSQATASIAHEHNLFFLITQLRTDIAGFVGIFRDIIEAIPEENENDTVVWETKTVLRRLEFVGTLCQYFCEWDERSESIFWIEKCRLSPRKGQQKVSFYPRFIVTPLSIAPLMVKGVFEPFKTVVCTSATLRISHSFEFWMNRTGASLVEKERLLQGEFSSPFPYKKNVLFSITTDAPLPDQSGFQSFTEEALVRLIQASNGRALVLFTAYNALTESCSAARRELQHMGITILKQGDDDRARLLEAFRSDENSVLFATDSFWEGVDVPGSTLSHVIIVKLPFSVPNDPVLSARSEAIQMRGGNSFMELSLPEAVIRFRQGFGRLMRRTTDFGAVTVLDRRLLEKRYGRIFLESVPETRQKFDTLKNVCNAVEMFLSS